MAFAVYGSEKLSSAAQAAAVQAATVVFDNAGVSASSAIAACQAEMLLTDELGDRDLTDEDFAEYGTTLAALQAYHGARKAAEDAIAQLDPSNAGFRVMLTAGA